ncbi:MAG: acylphosphatase [Gemmatimonadales bacterium]
MGARRWIVRGRVQGVGFRWFVWREAERLGLAGWVHNLPDGSVEVVAQGPEAALQDLDRALGQGPQLARVDGVDRLEAPQEVEVPKTFTVN